jgi:16S rRNA (adenine1518-N6/adenine1519-N6)-dimethyltransferase
MTRPGPAPRMQHRARKRFGQNFLEDFSVITRIINAIDIRETDHLVEIGPGKGALTESLVQQSRHLDVIEIDRDLAAYLRSRYAATENLTIHCTDALKTDFQSLTVGSEKLRIIGNLPYNISTPLLFHLLDQQANIRDMHFMLQKEVVDRICANPGSKTFGKLSVMIQFHCKTEALFNVPPHSFIPEPKVTSAVVRLTPRESPQYWVKNPDDFRSLVNQAFSKRRKTLRNALKGFLSAEEIESTGIDPTARAETLEIEDYTRLSDTYSATHVKQ